jgi:hypothetical protein
LLRVEAEFGIGLAPLGIASGERQKRKKHHGDTEARRKQLPRVHNDVWGSARKTGHRSRIIRKG